MANTTIQSLERGLSILAILAQSSRPMSLNEVAVHYPFDRSTVFRLIKTMVQSGFIHQNPRTKHYTLGFKVLQLAGAVCDNLPVEEFLRPLMHQVCSQTQQNTHLTILDGNEIVFIAVEQPYYYADPDISVGTRAPAMHTPLGLAFLAFANAATMDTGPPSAASTSQGSNESLQQILSKVRATKLVYDHEQCLPGIICLASPIFDVRSQVVCCLGVSGKSDHMLPNQSEYGKIVRQAALQASELLGYPQRRESALHNLQ